jgi:molybdopterin molybdotransferase
MALLTVAEAQARMLQGVAPLGSEEVPISESAGRVLAQPLRALRTQPPFASSAMDGYAIRAEDGVKGTLLDVIGVAPAGHAFDGEVQPGSAVRIFTGAPLPEGADSVIMQEEVTAEGGRIRLGAHVRHGQHVRPLGIDFREGDAGIPAGHRLDWRSISFAAAMNHGRIAVNRRPRVAIIATGDELVPPGSDVGPGQIVCSNSYGVAALASRLGAEVFDLGIAADTHEAIGGAVKSAIDIAANVIVTIGGASVGDFDLVRPVLGEAGMELAFWKIAMRPGKPLMFGRLGAAHVVGLPGNPVSSFVAARLFLDPLVRRLSGETEVLPKAEQMPVGRTMKANGPREDYVRARLAYRDGHLVAEPLDNQDSSLLSRFAAADALIIRPMDAEDLPEGALAPVIRL